MDVRTLVAAAAVTLFAIQAPAQTVDLTDEQIGDADLAAERMFGDRYIRDPVNYWRPSEVVARLRELGYVNIHDFDMEWDNYEVEATTPGGDDVEIEIDPVTGAITDVDEDWF